MQDGHRARTIADLIRGARQRLAPDLWDHVSGGVESETTLRRNRLAMETYAFRPRVLRGVAEPQTATTVLGQAVRLPVLLAPIGSIAAFHPDGALAPARVASRLGTVSVVGTLASPGLMEVASAATAPLFFQIYVRGDRAWLLDLVGRAEAAGYAALCLSVDSTGEARRERDLHNRAPHPNAGFPSPNLPSDGGSRDFQVRFGWEEFDWLRSATRLPIAVKGILTAEDAAAAVEHGADAIYVSNHGGRELDHCPSTLEVLAEVVAAVAGRAEVLADSGFLHGSDVVKALALGARAVLVGKLQVWALAAAGEPGLEDALAILGDEIRHTLRLLGVPDVRDLSPAVLRPSQPTRTQPPEWAAYQPVPLPDA